MQIKINKEYGKLTVLSSIKVEDIALLGKYAPDALCIKNDNGDEVFGVSYAEGHPSVSEFGVTFGATSADGHAKVVFDLPEIEDAKLRDAVADTVAPAFENLGKIEAQVEAAVNAVRRYHETLVNSIVIE